MLNRSPQSGMRLESLFSNPSSEPHLDFDAIRANESIVCAIDEMYQRNVSILDDNFRKEFSCRTPERMTELYFADWLNRCKGLEVSQTTGSDGNAKPDWVIRSDQVNPSVEFYIESHCPTAGKIGSKEAVTMYDMPDCAYATQHVDEDQIRRAVLRFSGGLREKARSGQACRAIEEQRPFVLAMSSIGLGVPIDASNLDSACPVPNSSLLFRFLFGWDRITHWKGDLSCPASAGALMVSCVDKIKKRVKEGEVVIEAGAFLPGSADDGAQQDYRTVSAVLFTGWSYLRSQHPKPPEVCLIHNLNAHHLLAEGAIPSLIEYFPRPDRDGWTINPIQR